MKPRPLPSDRDHCPCCGFPTLGGRATYEICAICDWEDDGQDDHNADEILGGPNRDYSLTEARGNFKARGSMYRPEDTRSFLPSAGPQELATKSELTNIFTSWSSGTVPTEEEEHAVLRLERKLQKFLSLRISEHESKLGKDEA